MRLYQWLFLIGIFLMLGALLVYGLSLMLVPDPVENTVVNPLGNTAAVDSTFASPEVLPAIASVLQHEQTKYIWLALILGMTAVIAGMILKRIQDGPDRFLDDDEEEYME
ncbi:MAG: hypothetical protein ONB27_00730 [candidate division KSB1 bacterium]|nr:hypothetical protein [candidate division KSB1 bacterium]